MNTPKVALMLVLNFFKESGSWLINIQEERVKEKELKRI